MLPLQGIRILDLSWLLPGPYATMLLADLGAEVIKVEQPGRGDYAREMMPEMFRAINPNKKSIALNLKDPGGCRLFYRLCATADIIIESFRPGVVKRLKVDYDTVKQYNPGIVYCSISGYGQDGPYASHPSHDITCLALSGGLSIPGDFNSPPVRSGIPLADIAASMFSALSISAALIGQLRHGGGSHIDISMTDSIISWVGVRAGKYLYEGITPEANEMPHLSPTNRIFPTKDGRYLAIGAVEEVFWRKLCGALGREEWLADERFLTVEKRKENWSALITLLEEVFRNMTLAECGELFAGTDLTWNPVYNISEAFSDPHIRHRGIIQEVDEGGKKVKRVRFPGKFSAFSPEAGSPVPSLGQHTESLLKELGLSDAEINDLKNDRII